LLKSRNLGKLDHPKYQAMKYLLTFLVTVISLLGFVSPIKEQTFVVYERGAKVSKAEIRRDAVSKENIIEIEALNVSGGSISMGRRNPVLPPAEVSSIISINGSYVVSRDIRKSGRGVVMQLLNVVYPYRARLTVSEQIFEFEVKQPGFWRININVSQ
jgi:hypothetical protein